MTADPAGLSDGSHAPRPAAAELVCALLDALATRTDGLTLGFDNLDVALAPPASAATGAGGTPGAAAGRSCAGLSVRVHGSITLRALPAKTGP